jgi:molybdopterin molybdotransferase
LEIKGQVAAGDKPQSISRGEVIRVFTGAAVPPNAFAVAMQEDCQRERNRICLTASVTKDSHIRRVGADFSAGDTLIPAGAYIRAAESAVLASQGKSKVLVFCKPRAAVIVTGNEISSAPQEIGGHEIPDSNGPMLTRMLEDCGGATRLRKQVADNFEQTKEALSFAASVADIILTSGGASVGDYDFIQRAVSDLGAVVFHGVNVKPGKPVLFGRIDGSRFVDVAAPRSGNQSGTR